MTKTGVTLTDKGEQMAILQSGGQGNGVLVWGVRIAGRTDHENGG
jgi:hypothetical protein